MFVWYLRNIREHEEIDGFGFAMQESEHVYLEATEGTFVVFRISKTVANRFLDSLLVVKDSH